MANPKDAMSHVLADIDGLQLIPRADYTLGRHVPRGYVFAIREVASNMIYIGWSGSTPIAQVLTSLQRGNPRPLSILCILRRDNVHDARAIADHIRAGLFLMHTRDSWFEVNDVPKITQLFAGIDELHPLSDQKDGDHTAV